MGFHLRKTKKFGLFNFNLSNSGLGASFGIKGLRAGIDGKGRAYIAGGKGILRYKKYLSNKTNNNSSLYDSINDTLPYMLKNNSLIFINKFLFWLIVPFLLTGSIIGMSKEPVAAIICLGIIYLIGLPIYFSKLAKARNYCIKAMKELKKENIKKALEYFTKALIYKNFYYQQKLKSIIEKIKN